MNFYEYLVKAQLLALRIPEDDQYIDILELSEHADQLK